MVAPNAPSRGSSSPRRTQSVSGSHAGSSITRGATARAAVSSKVNASINGVSRRASVSSRSAVTASASDGDSAKEELISALKRETEEKEAVCTPSQDALS